MAELLRLRRKIMGYKKRALLSVSDKEGIVELAKILVGADYEIISTGGTYELIKSNGVQVTYVSEITGFPEILDGRVKTLHPKIHGGILGKRHDSKHKEEMKDHSIIPIDLVAVNLYPFEKTANQPNSTWDDLIENIDIGGPAMIRAAAKNHSEVIVLVNPQDYQIVIKSVTSEQPLTSQERIDLAIKAYAHTSEYDGLIQETLSQRSHSIQKNRFLKAEMISELRYGENPQQKAQLYKGKYFDDTLVGAKQLQGKQLSYNNWLDSDSAVRIVQEFDAPVAVIIKHTNPCGVALGESGLDAFRKAFQADPISAFGGIMATNQVIDVVIAQEMISNFWEVIIAPKFTEEALQIFEAKPNVRLLEISKKALSQSQSEEWRSIQGGWLVQENDQENTKSDLWEIKNENSLSDALKKDFGFGMKVVKHIKSNAICVVKDQVTLGIGAGQMNRIGSAKIALDQAGEKAKGAILASDAFFPFGDTVELAAQFGITGIIQPGGSIRDEETIQVAKKHNINLVHTGVRHFRH